MNNPHVAPSRRLIAGNIVKGNLGERFLLGLLRSLTKPAATVGSTAASRKTEMVKQLRSRKTKPFLGCLAWGLVQDGYWWFSILWRKPANGPKLLTACNTSYPVARRVLANVTASVLGESVAWLCSGIVQWQPLWSWTVIWQLPVTLRLHVQTPFASSRWGFFFGGLALSYSLG